jgi:hypothetical protein
MLSSYERAFAHRSHGFGTELQWALWKEGLTVSLAELDLWQRSSVGAMFGTHVVACYGGTATPLVHSRNKARVARSCMDL